MSKITRAFQKIFASSATAGQIAEYGSAAASGFSGGTTYSGTTATPANVQSLAAWLEGWYGAVDGQYNPAIEDVNAVDWLFSRQLAYLFQAGVPEWDADTTYYIGSVVNDGTGRTYRSIADNNTNNAVSDTSKWTAQAKNPTIQTFTTGSGTYSTPSGVLYLKVRMVGAGGAGYGTSSGGNGGNTTFGSSLLTANGGVGSTGLTGGAGGTATVAGAAIGNGFHGGRGGRGDTLDVGTNFTDSAGGNGGATPFGGAGTGGDTGGAQANTGSGGGGTTYTAVGNGNSGGGGGAGGYIDAIINSPSATYAYAVGAKGTRTGGTAGNGADGIIIVEEYYQ